jgi:hypothetical protein
VNKKSSTKNSPVDHVEDWRKAFEKCRAASPSNEIIEEPEVCQLPLWPDPQRAAPNALLRSALFGVVRRGMRRFINSETLATWKGSSIRFKGEQLDQYDLDVWLQALHIARQQDLSSIHGIQFTARGFLKAMGRKYSGDAARVLFKSFERMVACAVTIHVGDVKYVGSLIDNFAQHEPSERYILHLNPKLKALFDTGNTRMDWVTRLALPMDLARWLHGYVLSQRATEKNPHRIGISTLRSLSGSPGTDLFNFRPKLRRAMASLAEARVVRAWRFTEGDALEFIRLSPLLEKEEC